MDKLCLDELGIAIHSIIRKYLSSEWSSLIWNCIHLTPDHVWTLVIQDLVSKIDPNGSVEDTQKSIYDQATNYEVPDLKDYLLRSELRVTRIFESAWRMMPLEDAKIIAEIIHEYCYE